MNDSIEKNGGGLTVVKQALNFLGKDSIRPTIVESWEGPTSWYRRWSNGWLEQGGSGNNTVSLPREFSDTNYFVVSTAQTWGFVTANTNKTRTSFTLSQWFSSEGYGTSNLADWYACGF